MTTSDSTQRSPAGSPDSELAPASLAAPVLVRRAAVEDARAIAEINVAGWQAAYRGILPDDYLENLPVRAREIALQSRLHRDEQGEAPAWVAERDGRAIGYLSSGPPRDDDVTPPAAEVYALYVVPQAWRTGAGRALMETAGSHWQKRGVATLVLWVLEANARGRTFYGAMGWSPDGGRQPVELGGSTTIELRYRISLA